MIYYTPVKIVCLTNFRKHKIAAFTMQLQLFLEHDYVRDERSRLLKRLSKRLVFLTVYFMILYALALYLNAVAFNCEISKVCYKVFSPINF